MAASSVAQPELDAIMKIFNGLLDSDGQDTLDNPDRIALINQCFHYAESGIEREEVAHQFELAIRKRVIDVYCVEANKDEEKDSPSEEFAALLTSIIRSVLKRQFEIPDDDDLADMRKKVLSMKLHDLRNATLADLTETE